LLDENKILLCVDNVPTLSPTVAKILQIAGKMNASADELIHVIKLDPVLTAKLLKLINSVYYGMPQKVLSIGRAVVLLGVNTVKNLALSTAVLANFQRKGKQGDFDMTLFWKHCLGCAVGSKLLAKAKKVNRLHWEEYFIAGLLHDIGKVALLESQPEEYARVLEVLRQGDEEELQAEDRLLGANHARIGQLIAEKWKISDELGECIAEHHHPREDGKDLSVKAAVYLSNINCAQKEIGFSFLRPREYDPAVLDRLDLSEERIDEILMPLEDEIHVARVFLES